mgnify:CR=1 FL=1
MDKLNDNKSTPTKSDEALWIKNEDVDLGTKNEDIYSREIEQPNRSNATPDIPQEVPVREM